jgi:hypothetical protein
MVSCTSSGQDDCSSDSQNSVKHIVITRGSFNPKEYGLDQAVSDVVYVLLETREDCLINRLREVFVIGDRLLVSDFSSLYMFDLHGRFLKSVGRKGQGPADYINVNTVIVDSDHRLFYLITLGKMLKYTFEGTYVESIKMDGYFACGVMTPSHTLLFYNPNSNVLKGDTSSVSSLIEMDTLGNRTGIYLNPEPRYVERQNNFIEPRRPLYLYRGEIRFSEFGNDTLSAVSEGTMSARLIIDLGRLKMDHNPDFSGMTVEEMLEYVKSEEKLCIRNICEDDNYCFIKIGRGLGGSGNDAVFNCIFDRNTEEFLCLGDGFSNTVDGGITFFPEKSLPDGRKVMWKNAEDFREEILSLDYMVQKEKYGDRFEKVYQLAQSLKEDDNPVLILAK